MKRKKMEKRGNFFLLFVILLGILISMLLSFLHHRQFQTRTYDENEGIRAGEEESAIVQKDPEKLLPEKLMIGEKAPEVIFQTSEGEIISVSTFGDPQKKGVWFSFVDCQNTEQAEIQAAAGQMKEISSDFDLTPVIVGNSSSEEYDLLIDPDGAAYQAWGLQTLPSDIILDPQGRVLEYHAGNMTPGEMKGLPQRAAEGRDSISLHFITDRMSDGKGGFYTSTGGNGKSPSGKDILSESQGLMMLAALEKNDPDLFARVWSFTKNHLIKNGLAVWYISEKGDPAHVNALIDDIRIWYALDQAEKRGMGAYADDSAGMLSAVKNRCLDKKGRLVDFVDLYDGEQTDTISLQYLDLAALDLMAQADPDLTAAYQNAVNILLDGRISDEFPLYYRSYNYKSRSYDSGYLNTAEALYTLWNLSRADLLPEDAFQWLREQVENGTLAASYKTNGKVVPGYNYHSTAVYALAALIARETGDKEMFETALRRMERKFILNAEDEFFGSYSQKGAAVYSFDQMLPFLVNVSLADPFDDGRE